MASQGRPESYASPLSGGWGGSSGWGSSSSGGALNSGVPFPASVEEQAGGPLEGDAAQTPPPPRWETPPTEQRPRGGAPAMGYMPVQYLKMTRADDQDHLEELMAQVPYRMSAMALYVKVQQNLTQALGRPPTGNEWAAALNMHPSDLRGSIEASSAVKARLVSRFSPLVRSVVNKYRGRGVPTRDLLQEGACGLIQAAERFDPSRGAQFSTYAVPWIRKHVSRSVQTHGRTIRLPQRAHEQAVKMGRTRIALTEQLGRVPTLEEVAAACNIKLAVAALYDTANSDMLSLDGAAAVRIGGVLTGAARNSLGDGVRCPGAQPEDAAAQVELRGDLHEVLRVLRPLERAVLSLRFGLAPAAGTAHAPSWAAGGASHQWAGRAHSYEEVIAVLAGDYPELVAKKDVIKVERRAFYQLQQPSAIAKIEQLRHAMYPQNPPEYSYRVGGGDELF